MANEYYQKHKKRLQKQAHERCQKLSEEEKKKKTKRGLRKMLKFY